MVQGISSRAASWLVASQPPGRLPVPVAGVLLWAALAATAGCGGLTHDNPRTIETIERLGDAEVWNGRVTAVRLRDRQGVDAVIPLLPRLPKLNALHIAGVALSEEQMRTIGQLNLLELRLEKCDVNDGDMRFLTNLTSLKRLNLIHNPITDDGLRHLSSMRELEDLNLSATEVVGPGFSHLKNSRNLEYLRLSNTNLKDVAMKHISQFRKLECLEFLNTEVTSTGLMKLTRLHWLNSIGTSRHISRDDMKQFRTQHTKEKELARAAGIDVPPEWQSPFGAAVVPE